MHITMGFYPTAPSRSAFQKSSAILLRSAKLFKVIGHSNHFSDYWQISSNWLCCFGRPHSDKLGKTRRVRYNISMDKEATDYDKGSII